MCDTQGVKFLLAWVTFAAMRMAAADLNHFFVAVDHETYAAIEGSGYLRSEFAAFEKRTTVRTDRTYSAIYFYGTHTYFELFDAVEGDQKVGDWGIGFSVDSQSAEPKDISSEKHLVTREWQGVQLPWFYMLSGLSRQGVGTFLMEYHPDFLAKWHPDAGTPNGITREAVLRRYKAVLPQAPADPMLEDVASLTVASPPEDSRPIEQWVRNFGIESQVQFVEPSSSERGVREVRFKLRRAPARLIEMRFGAKSVIKLRPDGTGLWTL
jgi:hypothetical protein